MKKLHTNEAIAAIDIGSNFLKMCIAEITPDGNINILEDVMKSTNIGRDTFSTKRITPETIRTTCADLKNFLQLMKDYKVKHFNAVATSGIREAENKQYILEQIRLRTGIKVISINTAEERYYITKALRYSSFSKTLNSKPTLVVNITTDAVESSYFEDSSLRFTDHVQIGSLRLKELISTLKETTVDSLILMQQYIDSKCYWLKNNFEDKKIKHLVALGGELNTIIHIIEARIGSPIKNNFIEKVDFLSLYDELIRNTSEETQYKYKLSKKTVDLLIPTVLTFYFFLINTQAEGIYTPNISLRYGIISDISDSLYDLSRKENSKNDIVTSTYYLSKKYKLDKKHSLYVEKLALSIFDQTTRLHKLGERERLYLRVASILHDIGGFISITNHCLQTYNIIKTLDIIGFSDKEINIIANIARYHSNEIPLESHENFYILNHKDKLLVSILASILKLAEALDISHLQKIQELKLTNSNNMLFFNLVANEDITLEELNFKNNSDFFEEVFGIKPII